MSALGLAIDTTFDDTSVAVFRAPGTLLAEATLSQVDAHAAFGGIVPERASRQHLEAIHPLLGHTMAEAQVSYDDLDWIAVSHLPGLMGSILVGLAVAKAMAFALGKPLIGVNHIEAHPYACLLDGGDFTFPALHLVVAGGHTLLILQDDHFQWHVVGRSLDDAAGECADKVARMFGLPMPGGKHVDALARAAVAADYDLPRPLIRQNSFDFSFSGLKTAMLRHKEKHGVPDDLGPLMAAFLAAIADVLVEKTFRARRELGAGMVTLTGGLAASDVLRQAFADRAEAEGVALLCPEKRFCTDNAAMVAVLAARLFAAGKVAPLDLKAEPNMPL